MRYQTVSHEELLKTSREQSDNARCGEMISNTTHSIHPDVGQRPELPKASTDCLLSLAAAPAFAIMALVAGIPDGGMPGVLCPAAHDASSLTGMVPMYLLMSALHSAPWLRLITNNRACPDSTVAPLVIGRSHPGTTAAAALEGRNAK
jgi:hypothetical protein